MIVPATKIGLRFRVAVVAGLLITSTIAGGCTTGRPTMQSLWNQVPPVPWTGRSHNTRGIAVVPDKPAEPAMAANVALKTDDAESDQPSDNSAGTVRSAPTLPKIGNRVGRVPRDGHGPEVPDEADSVPEPLIDTEHAESSIERLNAALSDDTNQAHPLPEKSLTNLGARIRIDSLLERARQLFDIGQLEQAHQTAQTAQELSDDSQIDYFPDEDRPIDMIRRIEAQLKLTRNTESETESETTDTSKPASEGETSKATRQSSPAINPKDKDASGLARIRRDWSTLFRREKKSAISPDTGTLGQEVKPVTSVAVKGHRNRDQQASHSAPANSSEPIVMANRSVSLSAPDPGVSLSTPSSADGSDSESHELESGHANSLSADDDQFMDAFDQSDNSVTMNPSLGDPADNIGQPEIDSVESMMPFRQVNSKVPEEPRVEIVDDTEARQSDWTCLYIIFGVCTCLAIACYRRGAT